MKPVIAPSILLIIAIAALPMLSETLYTPALPDIAQSLMVSNALVEYTLSVYLLGFAVGSLFFGKISDKYGRKPCLLAGFALYILGCMLCAFSNNIEMLLASRFLQAFGCSVGSVIGQAISRDAFTGRARGKLFATVGIALALTQAFGPLIGGMIDQAFGWPAVFLALIIIGSLVWTASCTYLPETHLKHNRVHHPMLRLAFKMLTDKKVLAYTVLVAGANGLIFSYYAEGSFYMIELLGLTPSYYGLSFTVLSIAWAGGGILSKKLHDSMEGHNITGVGILTILAGGALFSAASSILLYMSAGTMPHIITTIVCMSVIMMGIGITIPSALSEALQDYQHATGTASAIFGFAYYIGISLATFGMATIHNGSLITMPLYFLAMGLVMLIVFKRVIALR